MFIIKAKFVTGPSCNVPSYNFAVIAKEGIPEVAVKKGKGPENVRRKRERKRRKEIVVARKRVTAETEEKER